MYRDVAKRVLAVILTFCMIGTMPDFTLLAEVNSENGRADVSSEEELTVIDEDSETLEGAGPEVEASLDTEESSADSEETEDLAQTEDLKKDAEVEEPVDGQETEAADVQPLAEG